jgi:hypothetical protein
MLKISSGLMFSSIFVLMVLLNTSCHKENTSFNYNQAIETVSSYVEAQQMTDLLLNTYFKSISDSTLLTSGISEIDGANVTYTISPAKIVINYPYSKTDGYGHYRKGKYEAVSETSFFNPDDVINVSFTNFYYDNDSLNINNITIINKDKNTNNNSVFNISGDDIYRETADSTGNTLYIKYQFHQEFVLHKDVSSTYHTQNDYFSIVGDLMGIAQNTFTFNASILDTSKLIVAYDCNWIKSGIANIQLPDFIYNSVADFSIDGDCVNMYSVFTDDTRITSAFDTE